MKDLFTSRDWHNIPYIDSWVPNKDQIVYTHSENIFIAPICKYFGLKESEYPFLDSFNLKIKNSYRKFEMRDHICKYLNYFNAYYDDNQSLLTAYAKIKYMIDYMTDDYSIEDLKKDIKLHILSPSMMIKVDLMNNYNYSLNLKFDTEKKVLAYSDKHGKLLMKASIFIKMCIPIICHYMHKNPTQITSPTEFILDMYFVIFNSFSMDIISKLYETSLSITDNSIKTNPIWGDQNIRGIDRINHTSSAVDQVIYNLIPKYAYEKNIITFNHTSLQRIIEFTVTKKEFEYRFYSHKPNIGGNDDDEEDKFEDNLAKQDQALLLQTTFNYKYVLNKLEEKYGPLDPKEIEFFVKELSDENGHFILNPIQKELVFLYFYKYFNDPNGVIGNRDDYVKMLLLLKRMLQSTNNMIILPYILTGKIIRSFNKTSLKKSEKLKLNSSKYYPLLQQKYMNEKIINRIEAIIATIITLKVEFISYDDPELHGQKIPLKSDILVEELLQYILNI